MEDLLMGTIYDWIDLGLVRSHVREEMGVEDPELHVTAMEVVAQLIREGFVAAGDVDRDGFHAWDCTRGEAISRIDREWRAEPDPELWPFQVAALAPTQQGLAVIEAVTSREGDDGSWRERMSQSPLALPHPVDL
ncbi:hypothetical protein [Terrabacter carboxydivorans]|uniref:hypothetical protein n=1 Tax=Terrabacter carboxydivorans TaxID=619730 RepID=UPI0031CEBB3A